MSRCGWRPQIEDALVLDVWLLDKRGWLHDGAHGVLCWTSGGETLAMISYAVTQRTTRMATLTLRYSCTNDNGEREEVICTIPLSWIPLHYGGRRWYCHCPCTGRRARKLYKFSGIAQFCHRTAVAPLPIYSIQRQSGLGRIQSQRWAIRRKLGDDITNLLGAPLKPKWMRLRTFERYIERDAELAHREGEQWTQLAHRLEAAGRRLRS